MRQIKILLADDHPVVREGLRSCFASRPRLEVVGEAGDGLEALRKAKALSPDIVLMDISMPRMNGLVATERMRQVAPRVKVLILTVHDNKEYVRRMVAAGASGFVLKDSSPEELVRAIEAVYAGGAFFSPGIAKLMLNEFEPGSTQPPSLPGAELTERETLVLKLVTEGQNTKGIALRLGLSIRTVESHRSSLMRKLGIHTVAGLTKYAVARGLVPLS
jgi:DNA-binding NarL/FixJ family response regulator